ncbi:hypothetical protein Dsin_025617 [Dipteronia sinensis]|uniref:RNase H type-1 domain-containing protein n=1 Tax=Dipteronia sinensis TaxID=43782 RepID=A0AAD9ZWN8_9ROSI|nr:hypothetical protein Dsin_025617 [Dipteronia sinensis]
MLLCVVNGVPLDGVYKINTDAAINECYKVIGVGVIIRNYRGEVYASFTQRILACFSPPVAEATAILRGLRFAIDSGLLPVVLESDAKWVVDLINSDDSNNADIAHSLSKMAVKSVENFFWMEAFPPCISSVILEDCLP